MPKSEARSGREGVKIRITTERTIHPQELPMLVEAWHRAGLPVNGKELNERGKTILTEPSHAGEVVSSVYEIVER